MSSSTTIESTLMELVGAIDEHSASAGETTSVVRHVLSRRHARFVTVPLIEALARGAKTPMNEEER